MTITRITQYPLQFVVAFGDAFNGVSLHGPFTDSGDALDWAEEHRVSDCEFTIVPIQHAHQTEGIDPLNRAQVPDPVLGGADKWDDDIGYPAIDWQNEVGEGNTRLGYHEWVAVQRELEAEDEPICRQHRDTGRGVCADCGAPL